MRGRSSTISEADRTAIVVSYSERLAKHGVAEQTRNPGRGNRRRVQHEVVVGGQQAHAPPERLAGQRVEDRWVQQVHRQPRHVQPGADQPGQHVGPIRGQVWEKTATGLVSVKYAEVFMRKVGTSKVLKGR